jgi:alcohol dehydrogenase (NADP+)
MHRRNIQFTNTHLQQACVGAGLKEGMRRTGLRRSDLWITSKLWSTRSIPCTNEFPNQANSYFRHGDKAQSGLETNLQELGLEYLDLTLMHFPIGTTRNVSEYDYVATWKEMEKLVAPNNAAVKGKTRFIGISNFNVSQLHELVASATIKPKVHQIELHPYLQQNSFVAAHRRYNITLTAYAPLADTNPSYLGDPGRAKGGMTGGRYSRSDRPSPLLQNPVLVEIGKARNCTPAQVALAWNMRRGIPVHPKAARIDHIKENFDAYKCDVKEHDVVQIEELGRDVKFRVWWVQNLTYNVFFRKAC